MAEAVAKMESAAAGRMEVMAMLNGVLRVVLMLLVVKKELAVVS